MTQVLLDTFDNLGVRPILVDRRFSRNIGDVGRFSLSKVFSSVGLLLRMVWTIARHQPRTAVYFMTTRTQSFLVDFVLLQVLRILRIRTIGYLHTRGYRDLASRGGPFKSLVRISLSAPAHIVCLSPILAEDIAAWVDPRKTHFIANTPINPPSGQPEHAANGPLLYFSNLLPEKGASTFISMAVDLAEDYATLTFDVAGPPSSPAYQRELETRARPLGDRLAFAGRVGNEAKWRHLLGARLMVFPSQYSGEAQPLSIIESLAAATPVVAYSVGGVPDMIADGASGILIKEGDEAGLKEAVRSLLDNPERLARMSVAARERYEEGFSAQAYQDRWRAILSEALPNFHE